MYSDTNHICGNLYGITLLHTGKHGYTIYNRSQIYGHGKTYISFFWRIRGEGGIKFPRYIRKLVSTPENGFAHSPLTRPQSWDRKYYNRA